MQDILKPCPFCGGEAELVDFDPMNCFVECRKCRASQPALYNKVDKQSAVESWNHRADDADRARLVAQVEALEARVTELESAIVIDRGVFNRLCTLQAIMEHPTATPSAEEFNEYTGLLELVFHTHDEEAADNE